MNPSTASLEELNKQLPGLWPALKGSLAKVYKPCIRKGCQACQCGDKHPAWLLSFSLQGRRKCIYVPLDLVPVIRQALRNGRRLENILYQVGPAIVKEYRRQRDVSR